MFHSGNRSYKSPGNFILNRIFRIFPLYFLLTISFIILLNVLSSSLRSGYVLDIGYVISSLLFFSFIYDRSPIIYVAWTLEFEMFFYLAIFIFMLIAPRWKWSGVSLVFSTSVSVGALLHSEHMSSQLRFLTCPYLLEFVYGVSVAMWLEARRISPVIVICSVGATAMVLFQNPWNTLIVAGIPASFLLWAAVRCNQRWPQVGRVGQLVGILGDASYSIYLIQVFTIPAVFKVIARAMPGMPLYNAIALVSLSTIIGGMLVYIFAERPLLATTSRLLKSRRPLAQT